MGEVMSFTVSSSKALISPSIRSSSQINLAFNIPSTATHPKFTTFSCFHPETPKPVRTRTTTTAAAAAAAGLKRIPTAARDRVIDSGKYKGKMLGSLPSSYLEWISKNLRAGHTEEWAKLADQVLSDPVYRDRIEWEIAEKVLNGSNGDGSNAVTELLEINERFGWDNEDKVGWSKIDFGLLGTSKSGRIPRVRNEEMSMTMTMKEGKIKAECEMISSSSSDVKRRRERRERARRRRVEQTSNSRMGKKEETMNDEDEDEDVVEVKNRFPGREALLNKVLNCQRFYY